MYGGRLGLTIYTYRGFDVLVLDLSSSKSSDIKSQIYC